MSLSLDDYENMDPERSCMPTGQGCGGIDDVPSAGEIVTRIVDEARATLEHLGRD